MIYLIVWATFEKRLVKLFTLTGKSIMKNKPCVFGKIDPTLNHGDVCESSYKIFDHQGSKYMVSNNGFHLLETRGNWKSIDIPFKILPGQSVLSTSFGIVFFGGETNSGYSSEMWIFANSLWSPFSHDVPGCAYHASCWLEYCSSMFICGGKSENGDSPVWLLNLKNSEKTRLKLTKSITCGRQTLSYLYGQTICMYGGLNDDYSISKSIQLISLDSGLITDVPTIAHIAGKYDHDSFVLDGRLFAFGGLCQDGRSNNCWIFDFDNSIWVFFDINTFLPDASFLVPLSNGFHVFNNNGSRSVKLFYNNNMTKFIGDLIDQNLSSGMYRLDPDTCIAEHVQLLKNYEQVCNELKTRLTSLGKSSSHFNDISNLIQEYNNLQIRAFKIDLKLSELRRQQEHPTKGPPPIVSQSPTVESVQSLIKELSDAKERKSQEKKGLEDMISSFMNNVDGFITKRLQNPIDHSVLLDFDESRSNAAEEQSRELSRILCDQRREIEERKERIKSLKEQSMDLTESFIQGCKEVDNLNNKLFESENELHERKKECLKAISELNTLKLKAREESSSEAQMIMARRVYLALEEADVYALKKNQIKRETDKKINAVKDEFYKLLSSTASPQELARAAKQARDSIYILVDWISKASRQIGLPPDYCDKFILDGKQQTDKSKLPSGGVFPPTSNRKLSDSPSAEQSWEEFYEDVMKSITLIDN